MKNFTNFFNKTERYAIVLTLLLTGVTFIYSGCTKKPEKPDKPSIELKAND